MKKRIAYILFFVFVSSFSLELCRNIFAADAASIALAENEEDSNKKNTEEKDLFGKEKLICSDYVFAAKSAINQKYKTANLLKLPNPYLSEQIRPPELS